MDNELVPLILTLAQNTPDFGVKDYIKYCHSFHILLFKDIISINGEFRRSDHDGSGSVYFGGLKRQEFRSRFTGSKPENIETDLKEAFKHTIGL